MTEDQIKQKAEAYVNSIPNEYPHGMANNRTMYSYTDFIAGAHSRDEEIYDLKRDIEDLQKMVKMRSDAFKCARKEIDRLSNSWISTEERLPDPHTPVYAKNYKRTWFFALRTDNRVRPWYDIVGRHPEEVTHWKPIPEPNKEE